MLRLKALFPGLMAIFVAGFALGDEAIPNWLAPATWSPHSASRGASAMSAITSPLPFIGVTPCRVADTRGNGFTGQYGPPALVANATRSFTIVGQCSIPASAAAVSFNLGALDVGGAGDLRVFPAGGGVPLVSTLNYNANTPNIANAAVVALGTGGAITVQADAVSIDLIIDVNGYYAPAGVGTYNTFLGLNAGNFTMTGDGNTGVGRNALSSNTTGNANTANGNLALLFNTTGTNNTAVGASALRNNTTGSNNTASGASALGGGDFYRNTGSDNTASGANALSFNTTGFNNTAVGVGALFSNSTGSGNTATGHSALLNNTAGGSNLASGHFALYSNTTGGNNVASGNGALYSNTTGFNNTAVGVSALFTNSTGINNAALGVGAGEALTTGNWNVAINNDGVAGESGTIRIGNTFNTDTYIAGIFGSTTSGGIPVYINSLGKLGTILSAWRFKQDVRDIGDASESLMRLRPVAFQYKPEYDPNGSQQYGLIAEEVAQVMPDLVAYDRDGQPETVRYHFLVPMLLNELQKQQRQINELQEQQRQIEELKLELSALRAVVGQK